MKIGDKHIDIDMYRDERDRNKGRKWWKKRLREINC